VSKGGGLFGLWMAGEIIVAGGRIENGLLVEPFLFSGKGHKFRLYYQSIVIDRWRTDG
jgi:hypothetical protein